MNPNIEFTDKYDKYLRITFILYSNNLGPLAPDPPGELDVFGHNGDPLSMDGTQVGVLEQPNQISLTGFLESSHGGRLESQIGLEILSYFTNQSLEGQLPDEQLSRLLVTTDLPKGHCARSVSMGLLHTPCARGTLPGCLGG